MFNAQRFLYLCQRNAMKRYKNMEEITKNIMVCPKCKSHKIDSLDGTYRCLDCGCEWNVKGDQPQMQSLILGEL